MGLRASMIREFKRRNRRSVPKRVKMPAPYWMEVRSQFNKWMESMLNHRGRRRSSMGSRARRRYSRAIARQIHSGSMSPKAGQYAACLALMSQTCQLAAKAIFEMARSIGAMKPSLMAGFPSDHFSTDPVAPESIPSQATGTSRRSGTRCGGDARFEVSRTHSR